MLKSISFPSKTFLIGEYAALNKGPCILVNTEPRFTARFFSKNSVDLKKQPHPESPAGQWLKKYPDISFTISDPHKGKGGFGFSSAQFNAAYAGSHQPEDIKVKKLWEDYCSLDFKGLHPSGADVCSQWLGFVCLFQTEPFTAKTGSWPFKDLDFFLIRTGVKLDTWKHLRSISDKNFSELKVLAQQACLAFELGDSKKFLELLDQYSVAMEKQNLLHEKTSNFLKKIRKVNQVMSARGCGAMGAEIVACFFHPRDRSSLKQALTAEEIVASSTDLTAGLLWE